MDTPKNLRGKFYNTHLEYNCRSYQQCKVCKMCENYNPSHLACHMCESAKPNRLHCACPLKTKLNYLRIEEKLRAPLFDPNAKGKIIEASVAYDPKWDEIAADVSGHLGKMHRI